MAAWIAYALLPDGHVARLAVAVPFLLVVPGYLLLEASLAPRTPAASRWLHLALALGVTPPVVGLVAVAAALVPGGFQAPVLVGGVAGLSLALAVTAFVRRQGKAGVAQVPLPHPTGRKTT